MMDEEKCVSCGATIPEGQQVCNECRMKALDYGFYVGYAMINNLTFTHSGTLAEMVKWMEEQMMQGANEMKMWKEE